ncbi:hypothetical protein ACTMTI_53955 [Nonomuraea sp. H19]|uniref:hypothetical protein n=1 Tax=Nonomuraea sp. H19 TaxID=3452206 RepID=UPI003F88F519
MPIALLAALGLVSLVTIAVLLPTSRPEEEPAAYATSPDVRRFGTVLAAGALSATGAFTGYTYIVTFLGDVGGLSPSTVSVLFAIFGVACLAGVSITGAFLDRFPQSALAIAVATQAVGMLGLYAFGAHQVAAAVRCSWPLRTQCCTAHRAARTSLWRRTPAATTPALRRAPR